MTQRRRLTLAVASALVAMGCMQVHQIQLGEIDSQAVQEGRKFELLVSDTGVNVEQAAEIAGALLNRSEETGALADIVALFQMGPRTGNAVYQEEYTDMIHQLLLMECPSGRITGMTCIRETANYPVVSGEIVRITGYCIDGGPR